LFANHIIQHYPGNLQRQGNAVAEANHSSVLQRLGAAFYESPVKLIRALLNRHNQISAERDHLIRTYAMEACSKAYQLPNGNEKDAMLNLGKWGMELFQSSMENSERMDMTLHADGKFAFPEKRHPDRILLTLDPSATECSC
jgi:hypothetical protein